MRRNSSLRVPGGSLHLYTKGREEAKGGGPYVDGWREGLNRMSGLGAFFLRNHPEFGSGAAA